MTQGLKDKRLFFHFLFYVLIIFQRLVSGVQNSSIFTLAECYVCLNMIAEYDVVLLIVDKHIS